MSKQVVYATVFDLLRSMMTCLFT